MIRMNHVMKSCFGVALSFMALGPVAAEADDYKLVSNQRIACGRGLNPGKLNTATCKSYAYLFNSKTSEYFRCQVTLVMTRDNKEVINVQTDGGCAKRPRIFENDSSYSFDATETEPPNTKSPCRRQNRGGTGDGNPTAGEGRNRRDEAGQMVVQLLRPQDQRSGGLPDA